ncbi:natural killer cells antigen CD94-like [Saccopteryx leptura]|uniref:natural killer cells antigen CD94-like n=1 Tax=Saccopteryx leptura TaxID=249018 RepID=UPI00339D0C36
MAAFQTAPWRLISAFLGVTCLVLMATLGIMLKNKLDKQSIQPTSSPGHPLELQEGSGCCSCQEKWIGYQCNCYFISNEQKTWSESKKFCASQNSSLLQLLNRDELHFMKSNTYFYWIGLSYSEKHGAWLWEDGSALSQDQLSFTRHKNPRDCMSYSPTKSVLDEPCKKENYYICKQQLI